MWKLLCYIYSMRLVLADAYIFIFILLGVFLPPLNKFLHGSGISAGTVPQCRITLSNFQSFLLFFRAYAAQTSNVRVLLLISLALGWEQKQNINSILYKNMPDKSMDFSRSMYSIPPFMFFLA